MTDEILLFSVTGLTVRGFHHTYEKWVPKVGLRLHCQRQLSGPIEIINNDQCVGTVATEVAEFFKPWLTDKGEMEAVVMSMPKKHKTKGKEVPVVYVFKGINNCLMENNKRSIKKEILTLQKKKKSVKFEEGDPTINMVFSENDESELDFTVCGMTLRGFHYSKKFWVPEIGERLKCSLSDKSSVEIVIDGRTVGNVEHDGQELWRSFIHAGGDIYAVIVSDPRKHKSKGQEIPVNYEFSAETWTNHLKNERNVIKKAIGDRGKKKKSLKLICSTKNSDSMPGTSSETSKVIYSRVATERNRTPNEPGTSHGSQKLTSGPTVETNEPSESNENGNKKVKSLKRQSIELPDGSPDVKVTRMENTFDVTSSDKVTSEHLESDFTKAQSQGLTEGKEKFQVPKGKKKTERNKGATSDLSKGKKLSSPADKKTPKKSTSSPFTLITKYFSPKCSQSAESVIDNSKQTNPAKKKILQKEDDIEAHNQVDRVVSNNVGKSTNNAIDFGGSLQLQPMEVGSSQHEQSMEVGSSQQEQSMEVGSSFQGQPMEVESSGGEEYNDEDLQLLRYTEERHRRSLEGQSSAGGHLNGDQSSVDGVEPSVDDSATDLSRLDERWKSKSYIPPKETCIFDGRLIKLVPRDIDDLIKNNTILIGEGSFGKVYKSENPSDGFGMHVVVKKIPLKEGEQDRSINREMMASRIVHPFILPLLAVVERPKGNSEIWFVSPLCKNGDLHGVIRNKSGNLNIVKRSKILFQIALAIQYIHTKVPNVREVILHKDIASKNVVLDANYNARLIDFGLAREIDDTTTKAGGRDYYAHPDVGKGYPAKETWDHFAFGVIIRELLTSLGPEGANNKYLKFMTEEEVLRKIDVNISEASNTVEKLVKISCRLLEDQWSGLDFKSKIVEELKLILKQLNVFENDILPLTKDKCHLCMINPKARESSMTHDARKCSKISTCIACEKNSYLNPITCSCGTELTPAIGNGWGALLVAGTDADNNRSMVEDIIEVEKLITSKAPRIIGMSKENVKTVLPDSYYINYQQDEGTEGQKLWPKVKGQIEYFSKRTDINTLLIYFSCHGVKGSEENLFQLGSLSDSISMDNFQKELERLGNIEKLVIVLDRCFPQNVQLKETEFQNKNRKFIQINASRPTERAFMGGDSSTFTKWFIQGLKARSEKSMCRDRCPYCREYWQMTTDFITFSSLYKYLFDHLKDEKQAPTKIDMLNDESRNFAFHTDEEICIEFTYDNTTKDIPIGYLQDMTNLREKLMKDFKKTVGINSVVIERRTYRKDKEFEICSTLEQVMQAWVLRQPLKVSFKTE